MSMAASLWKRAGILALATVLGGVGMCAVFAVVLKVTRICVFGSVRLPDGGGIALLDPAGVLAWGVAFGALMCPAALFLLWRVDVARSLMIVGLTTGVAIAVLVPVAGLAAAPWIPLASLTAMVACRYRLRPTLPHTRA